MLYRDSQKMERSSECRREKCEWIKPTSTGRTSDLVWKTLILFEAVMYLVKPLRFRPLAHCLAFLVITITSWQVLRKANIFTLCSYRILTKSFFQTTSQVSPASCRWCPEPTSSSSRSRFGSSWRRSAACSRPISAWSSARTARRCRRARPRSWDSSTMRCLLFAPADGKDEVR